ncbi:hypothetical protein Sjap_001037 [Stephania japonica]|uniref:BAHD acyltransferase n=1 Tax=Stephania japonica TaxID=461633 RepID=A0AAP0KLI1_9MAGN
MPSLLTIVSRSTITPAHKSSLGNLKLSVSDLPMLSCQYIQKGVLLTRAPLHMDDLIPHLKRSLACTLTHFPPLAGRLATDDDGFVYIACNDAGVEFVHANAPHVSIRDAVPPGATDVPVAVKEFFTLDGAISYDGHFKTIAAVQVTELADGVFIGCTVNHAVTDGTSFWNFFNTFAELSKVGVCNKLVTPQPDFRRNFVKETKAVLKFPDGSPKVTFDVNAPLRERIFHFSKEAILKMKSRANNNNNNNSSNSNNVYVIMSKGTNINTNTNTTEILGKQSNDWTSKVVNQLYKTNGAIKQAPAAAPGISSFQSLCAQLWRSVTRARKLPAGKPTTFRMAVNCRHRLEPKIEAYYFGNAIQSIPTVAAAGDVVSKELRWCAEALHRNVVAHDDATVRRGVEEWEKNPRCFPLGNFDGAMITMGSSPRFPMYNNDFGWGRPVVVRSGKANKFDGKISAFPGRDGDGSVDLEVCLAPETMAGLETDPEFMQYVSIVE